MCQMKTYEETYWTTCWWWIFPYPCKRSHVVTKWCCDFKWVKVTKLFFVGFFKGCEGGQLYMWVGFAFGLGTTSSTTVHMCFNNPLTPVGTC
jgi:hypothetical protein